MENQYADFEQAGFGRRLAAFMLDMLLLSVVGSLVIGMLFPDMAQPQQMDPDTDPREILTRMMPYLRTQVLTLLPIYILYDTVLSLTSLRGTLGKRLLGIQVLSDHYQPLTLLQALGRAAMKFVVSSICYLGFIWYFFSKKEQTLHDVAAHTYVLKR